MEDEELSVQNVIDILSGNRDTSPVTAPVPSAEIPAMNAQDVESLLRRQSSPVAQQETEVDLPDAGVAIDPVELEETLSQPTSDGPSYTPGVDGPVLPPRIDDDTAPVSEEAEVDRLSRLEEAREGIDDGE